MCRAFTPTIGRDKCILIFITTLKIFKNKLRFVLKWRLDLKFKHLFSILTFVLKPNYFNLQNRRFPKSISIIWISIYFPPKFLNSTLRNLLLPFHWPHYWTSSLSRQHNLFSSSGNYQEQNKPNCMKSRKV